MHLENQSFLFTNECTSDCLKNSIKIYIRITPTCFDVGTPPTGSSLSVLAKVTLASTDNELPEDGVTTHQSYSNVNFNTVFETITSAFVGE